MFSGRWSVVGEDLFGDGHGGHGLGPAGVEGQVGDRFDELVFGRAVALREIEVEDELFGAAAGGEAGDGDQAALLRRQLWTGPHLSEEDVVSEPDQRRGEVAEHPLGARWFLVVVSHGLFPPESVAGAGGGTARRWAARAGVSMWWCW